jgi:photosystem II stability/assembly factor-like uncharacterized protein
MIFFIRVALVFHFFLIVKSSFSPAPNGYWSKIVISSSGKFIAACSRDQVSGNILISKDFGGSWDITSAPSAQWKAITMSATGQYLAAVIYGGSMYLSNDFGNKWFPVTSSELPAGNWMDVTSSSDGKMIYACGFDGVFLSFDWGSTFSPSSVNKYCKSISTSGEGKYIAALIGETAYFSYTAFVHISNDFGKVMTPSSIRSTSSFGSNSVSVSSTGSTIVVFDGDGSSTIFVSTDYGRTWPVSFSVKRTEGSYSASGGILVFDKLILVAAQLGVPPSGSGGIYASTDAGKSWIDAPVPSGSICHISSSSDGSVLAVGLCNGPIYLSRNKGDSWYLPSFSPTKAPSFDVTLSTSSKPSFAETTAGKATISIVCSVAGFLLTWFFRMFIAFKILSHFGFKYIILSDQHLIKLSSDEIGVVCEDPDIKFSVNSEIFLAEVDDGTNHGLKVGLIRIIHEKLENKDISFSYFENIQLTDFLLSRQCITPKTIMGIIKYYKELGIFRGVIYYYALTMFHDDYVKCLYKSTKPMARVANHGNSIVPVNEECYKY